MILKGGQVVFEHEVKTCDIRIEHGRIVEIGQLDAKEVLDVSDCVILPGAIDPHVHFNEPSHEDWEGFVSGSNMLLKGGVTHYFDMPLNGVPPTTTAQLFKEKLEIAKQKSVVDVSLWGGLVPGNLKELRPMHELGAIGFKAFMSPSGLDGFDHVDDETLFLGMQEIASFGGIVALHAENATITTILAEQAKQKGQVDAKAYHASRPVIAEVEAVTRALYFAQQTGCKLHFVHISTREAVDMIERAKRAGIDVTLETCPHYLLFNDHAYERAGVYAKCAPPLRSETMRQQLVRDIVDERIDFLASDHSPCPPAMKTMGNGGYFDAWGGINGGQFTLLSALSLVDDGFLTLPQVAALTSTNVATRFNLNHKGCIAIGYDASLSIVKRGHWTVTKEAIAAKHKGSLYEGVSFGWQVAPQHAFLHRFITKKGRTLSNA